MDDKIKAMLDVVLYGIIILLILVLFGGGLPLAYCRTQGSPFVRARAMQVRVEGQQMIIQGAMNGELAPEVRRVLGLPHGAIDTVLLSSPGGGVTEAEAIAAELDKLGLHRVLVPAGFACESACIRLALGGSVRFEPAPSAVLLFHRTWSKQGPDSCWACRVVDWEENHLRDVTQGKASHRAMYDWAEDLAPGLGQALVRCKPRAFDTLAGITITGAQFAEYRERHDPAAVCDVG